MSLPTSLDVRKFLEIEEDGACRLDRRVYTDPAIFDLELKHIWEKVWVFVAHESQLSRPHDFLTTQIGRQPILVTKDQSGSIGAFINACRHRGAKLCQVSKGNAKLIRCPYHDWVYSSSGHLVSVKAESGGGYPPSFDRKALGLTPVPRLEIYRGFIFASLNPDIEPLKEYLGDAATFIDLLVDQAPNGWEVLRGVCSYSYDGNWKLQAENGVDMYHVTTVHGNLAATVQNRLRMSEGENPPEIQLQRGPADTHGGFYDFGHGHVAVWRQWAKPENRFNYADRENVARRMGEIKANWAIGRFRNVLIYPSLVIGDIHSTQIRVLRPLSVDKTQVITYAIAPIGEPAEQRKRRLRAFEDFFNPSGMATPDDLAVFRASQQGFSGAASRWSDISRGAMSLVSGPDQHARELGINPRASGLVDDEGLFVAKYRYWMELLERGQSGADHT